MTLKYNDLDKFVTEIKKLGYTEQIPRQHLDFFIAKKFGISKYIKDNLVNMLVEFGFLKVAGIGVFNICSPWRPDLVKEKHKKVE